METNDRVRRSLKLNIYLAFLLRTGECVTEVWCCSVMKPPLAILSFGPVAGRISVHAGFDAISKEWCTAAILANTECFSRIS